MEGPPGGSGVGPRTPPWRVGIVGCGRIAGSKDQPNEVGPVRTHAQAYVRHPRFQLAAAVHPHQDTLRLFQQRWRIPRGRLSVEEMLEGEPLDVIDLCSPTALHFPQAVRILTSPAKPRVLFIEKPVCLKPGELDRLVSLATAAGVGVIVNHTRRFDPAHRHVTELVHSKKFGALVEGRCTYYGGWLNNGTHLIDTVRMMFPEEPQVASAAVSDGGRGDDENLNVQLTINGSRVFVAAFEEMHYQLFESDFRFESGRIQLLDAGTKVIVERATVNELDERVLVPFEASPLEGLTSPLNQAVAAIDAYLNGNDEFQRIGVDLSNARVTMNMVWQAREMAANGSGATRMIGA